MGGGASDSEGEDMEDSMVPLWFGFDCLTSDCLTSGFDWLTCIPHSLDLDRVAAGLAPASDIVSQKVVSGTT